MSRGFKLYFTETDYSDASDFSSYRTDVYGVGVNYRYPINENERLRFGFGFDNTTIYATQSSADAVRAFVDYVEGSGGTQSEGFNTLIGSASWRRSTLNRGVLPIEAALTLLGWSSLCQAVICIIIN